MTLDKHLQDYIDLCERMYLRMEREQSWPWAVTESQERDSTDEENLIDS